MPVEMNRIESEQLMDRTFLRKFLKSLVSSSFGTAATVLFHFFSIMVVVRYAPVEDFGLYMLLLAIVHGLRVISGLGLDLTLVKFTAAENTDLKKEDLFAAIFLTRLLVTMAVGLAALGMGRLFASHFDPRLAGVLIYLPVLGTLSSLKELVFYYFQGLYLFKKYALISVFSAAFKFALIFVYIVAGGLDLSALVQIELLALVGCLAVQFVAMPAGSFRRLLPHKAVLAPVLRFGLALYLNNLLTFAYERSSVFIIGALLNPASIALYEVAAKIPEGLQRLFSSFIAVYFPSLSRLLSAGQNKSAEKVMNTSLVFLSAAAIFLALAAYLFRDAIIGLLFSEKYLDATLAFALLMVNFQIIMVSYTLGYSLVSAGYPSLPFKINSIASAVNIAASFAFIPPFGFIGAVYASLLMNVTAMLLNFYHLRRIGLQPNLVQYFTPLAIALGLAGLRALLPLAALYFDMAILGLYTGLCFLFNAELRTVFAFRAKLASLRGAQSATIS